LSTDSANSLVVPGRDRFCNFEGYRAGERPVLQSSRRRNERTLSINIVGWLTKTGLAMSKPSKEITLAGVAPLFFKVAPPDRVDAIVKTLKEKFVQPGGVVTSLKKTGQQWDSPNGWAPLQWLVIQGLRNYGQDDLAKDLTQRWMKLNLKVYKATGKLMEKYDVTDLSKPAGSGEYPDQDGFGWTNGVFLELVSLYGMPVD
jgi:alpha,alpha-trehalase